MRNPSHLATIVAVVVVCAGFTQSAQALDLRAHWAFDGDLTDSSGYGNDLSTTAGAITYDTTVPPGGFSTQSAAFDGSDQLKTSSPNGLDVSAAYTITGWLKAPLPGANDYYGLFSRGPAGTGSDIEMYIQKGSNDFVVAHNRSTGVGTFDYVGFADPPDDVLTHVAVTYDSAAGGVKVYYDGVAQNVVSETAALAVPEVSTGYGVSVGKLDHSIFTPNNFNGLLDEVMVYDGALTSGEIDRLMTFNEVAPLQAGVLYNGEDTAPGGRIGDKLPLDGAPDVVLNPDGFSQHVTVTTSESRFGDGAFDFPSPATATNRNTLELPGTAELGHEFTLAAFVKVQGTNKRVFSTYPGTGSITEGELILNIEPVANPTYGSIRFDIGDGTGYHRLMSDAVPTFTQNEWHHVAATYDDGKARVYLDGVLIGSDDNFGSGPILLGQDLRVGEDYAGGANEQFIGQMDEILVLHKSLSAEQIAQLATSPALDVVPEPSTGLLVLLGLVLGGLAPRPSRGRRA